MHILQKLCHSGAWNVVLTTGEKNAHFQEEEDVSFYLTTVRCTKGCDASCLMQPQRSKRSRSPNWQLMIHVPRGAFKHGRRIIAMRQVCIFVSAIHHMGTFPFLEKRLRSIFPAMEGLKRAKGDRIM